MCLLPAAFQPENEGDMFLRNIGSLLADCMAYPRRQNSLTYGSIRCSRLLKRWIFRLLSHRKWRSAVWKIANNVLDKPSVFIFMEDLLEDDCQTTNLYTTWDVRQEAIAKTPAKWSVYQIPRVIFVFLILVFKVYFVSFTPKSHKRLWTY
jgi:hypothetical protein